MLPYITRIMRLVTLADRLGLLSSALTLCGIEEALTRSLGTFVSFMGVRPEQSHLWASAASIPCQRTAMLCQSRQTDRMLSHGDARGPNVWTRDSNLEANEHVEVST